MKIIKLTFMDGITMAKSNWLYFTDTSQWLIFREKVMFEGEKVVGHLWWKKTVKRKIEDWKNIEWIRKSEIKIIEKIDSSEITNPPKP